MKYWLPTSSPRFKWRQRHIILVHFLATDIYCISWAGSANKTKTKESPPHLENKKLFSPIFVIKTEECAYHPKQVTIRGAVQQLSYSCRYLPSERLSIFCLSSSCSVKCFFWANKRVNENVTLFSAWNTLLQDDSVVMCKVHRVKIL